MKRKQTRNTRVVRKYLAIVQKDRQRCRQRKHTTEPLQGTSAEDKRRLTRRVGERGVESDDALAEQGSSSSRSEMTQEKKKSRPNSKGRQEHCQQQAEKSNANSKLEMNRTSTANCGLICAQAEGRKKKHGRNDASVQKSMST